MHRLFDKTLSFFAVSEKYIPAIVYDLECTYEESTKEQRDQQSSLKLQLDEVEREIAALKRNYYMKNLMNQETFEEMYLPAEAHRANINRQLAQIGETISNPSDLLSKVAHFCGKLNTTWASGSVEFKQDLQKLIFPEGILYDKKNKVFRTEKINEVFRTIASLKTGLEGNEKGTELLFKSLSLAAERRGFEP